MKSETIELEFVNDLMTEARMFRSAQIIDYSST